MEERKILEDQVVVTMEIEGLVSPAAGGKPREVLVDKAHFDD